LLVVAINKTDQAVAIETPIRHAHEQWLLAGPAIDAKQGVTLTKGRGLNLRDGVLHVGPYSAVLVKA
jgi:hypothetical protein